MSGSSNQLTLQVGELRLHLEGPASRLGQVYAAVRPQLLTLLHEAMSEADAVIAEDAPFVEGETTQLLDNPAPDATPRRPRNSNQFVEVVICEEIYHQMCLLDKARFEESWLDRLFDREQINRLYVDAASEADFRRVVELGDTLWRELTTAGQSTVEGSR
ncbi:MAG: hypothetical protein ACOCV2_00200 [Persicimonas sp.]